MPWIVYIFFIAVIAGVQKQWSNAKYKDLIEPPKAVYFASMPRKQGIEYPGAVHHIISR
jgi:hypothetical protein